jgi:hypothetical protein
VRRLRGGRRIELADWIVTAMPTGLLLEIARDLSHAVGAELLHL